MSLNPTHDEVYLIQLYVIKFVSGFHWVLWFQWLAVGRSFSPVSSTGNTDPPQYTEILFKVVLKTMTTNTLPSINLVDTNCWFYTYRYTKWVMNVRKIKCLLTNKYLMLSERVMTRSTSLVIWGPCFHYRTDNIHIKWCSNMVSLKYLEENRFFFYAYFNQFW